MIISPIVLSSPWLRVSLLLSLSDFPLILLIDDLAKVAFLFAYVNNFACIRIVIAFLLLLILGSWVHPKVEPSFLPFVSPVLLLRPVVPLLLPLLALLLLFFLYLFLLLEHLLVDLGLFVAVLHEHALLHLQMDLDVLCQVELVARVPLLLVLHPVVVFSEVRVATLSLSFVFDCKCVPDPRIVREVVLVLQLVTDTLCSERVQLGHHLQSDVSLRGAGIFSLLLVSRIREEENDLEVEWTILLLHDCFVELSIVDVI